MKQKIDFKNMSRGKLLEYIWDYYKYHILIGLFTIVILVSCIVNLVKPSPTKLSVVMINTFSYLDYTKEPFEEFLSSKGYELTEDSVNYEDLVFTGNVTYDYQNEQKLTIFLAGDGDILFGNGEIFDSCIRLEAFIDLRDILSEELLTQYQDDLLYCETESGENYPCAVSLANSPWAQQHPEYADCYFGILYNTEHKDTAFDLADYLLH